MNRFQLRSLAQELHHFVFHFKDILGFGSRRASYCKTYLSGLMLNGERKSLYPLCERLNKEKEYNNLQQFLTDSPWEEDELLRALRKTLIQCPFLLNHYTIYFTVSKLDILSTVKLD